MLTNTPQGNIPEGKLLSDDRFLRRVAQLYYEDGQTQEAIAEMEFCSRQAIGKALQKARDRGIVRISVVPEQRTGYLRNLSRDLRVAFGLEDLVIVAGRNLNEIPPGDTAEDVLTDIATTAADYLDQLLTDSDILAVSGGINIVRNRLRPYNLTTL
jgi:deoxyribonucleoside regulator